VNFFANDARFRPFFRWFVYFTATPHISNAIRAQRITVDDDPPPPE